MYDLLQGALEESQGQIKGVAIGIVTDNKDPEGMGRIKVKFPWVESEGDSHWARISTLMAGKDRGTFFLPEPEDEVLVAFDKGDIRHPYILGALWNGQDNPPETNADGENNRRIIKSRSGHQVILDDKSGSEKIEIIDKSEKNSITIDTASNTITIKTDKDIQLKAPQGKITIEAMELELKSSAGTKIKAGTTMDLKAGPNMTIKGGMVMIN